MQDRKMLFQKYLEGRCSQEEIRELMALFGTDSNDRELQAMVEDAMQDSEAPETGDSLEIAALLERNRLSVMRKVAPPVRRIPLYVKIIAAACLLILTAAIIQMLYRDMSGTRQEDHLTNTVEVMPGGNRATLRLSNGKTITLDGSAIGKLADDGGATVTKGADGLIRYSASPEEEGNIPRYNVVSTPKGGQYQIVLPDGTHVWLNAASSLTYSPNLYSGGKRMVTLNGEAYFEVAKDVKHPFVVASQGQLVKVLGTHFNINSYSDEPATVTTLTEGSVQVQSDKDIIKIKPGQQSLLSANHSIEARQADVSQALAWKNGDLAFQDADIKQVMRQLARWYDLDIEYRGAVPDDTITGTISRQSKLSSVLKMLGLMQIHFQIEQGQERKKLIVYK